MFDAKQGIFECYIPADAYAKIDLAPSHFTENARFRLSISLAPNPTGTTTVRSPLKDPEAKVGKRFADKTVHAVDIRPATATSLFLTPAGYFQQVPGNGRTELVAWPRLNTSEDGWNNDTPNWYCDNDVFRWRAPGGRLSNKLSSE